MTRSPPGAEPGRGGHLEPDAELDEPGPCPAPIIALGRALRSLPERAVVSLTADDPVVATDVPAWCSMVGAEIVGQDRVAGRFRYLIRLPGRP